MTTEKSSKLNNVKPRKLILSLILALLLLGLIPILTACQTEPDAPVRNVTSYEDGWVQDEGDWFYFENGSKVTGAWRKNVSDEGEDVWKYLDRTGAAVSDRRQLWIESPYGAWTYIAFNEHSHALDMSGALFTRDSLYRFC